MIRNFEIKFEFANRVLTIFTNLHTKNHRRQDIFISQSLGSPKMEPAFATGIKSARKHAMRYMKELCSSYNFHDFPVFSFVYVVFPTRMQGRH